MREKKALLIYSNTITHFMDISKVRIQCHMGWSQVFKMQKYLDFEAFVIDALPHQSTSSSVNTDFCKRQSLVSCIVPCVRRLDFSWILQYTVDENRPAIFSASDNCAHDFNRAPIVLCLELRHMSSSNGFQKENLSWPTAISY
jgi:hypothetical protein